MILAGGTSMVPGFRDLFEDQLKLARLPFDMGEVRMAEEPMTSVARGCLIAAVAEEEARARRMASS